jgi:hypothetical protein
VIAALERLCTLIQSYITEHTTLEDLIRTPGHTTETPCGTTPLIA